LANRTSAAPCGNKAEALAGGRLAFVPMHIARCPHCTHASPVSGALMGSLLTCSHCGRVALPKGARIMPKRERPMAVVDAAQANKQTVQELVPIRPSLKSFCTNKMMLVHFDQKKYLRRPGRGSKMQDPAKRTGRAAPHFCL
jgi:hypothetical protein